MPGYQTQFLEFDQKRPLAAIVQDISNNWNLADPSKFALQTSDTSKTNTYITESNRHEIQNGNVLTLAPSPAQTAHSIITKLGGHGKVTLEEKLEGLRQLVSLAADYAFAEEFIGKHGLPIIIDIITDGLFKKEPLALTLKSFMSLMDHGIVSWDILEADFIKKVADCVNVSATLDKDCLQSALEILESVVIHSSGNQNVVEQSVTAQNIIPHLEKSDLGMEVHKNAIALINALFMKADIPKRKKIAESLQSKSMRTTILSNVIRHQNIGAAMAHQLYVLQALLLNLHEERMKAAVDTHDQIINKDIEELRRIAFEIEGDPNMNAVRRSQNAAGDFKKLGFENQSHPAMDLCKASCGLLALDCMLYFARNHGENYVKVVLENSMRSDDLNCPFVLASMHLTKMLCDILKIGEPPDETSTVFYSMFFSSGKPLEEFFCICIQLLNKTWREMRAVMADFNKVLEVVKEQVTRGLQTHSSSFEAFRNKVFTLTYSEIVKLLENERKIKEEFEAQAKPVVELRKKLMPEITELIRQQRLKYLVEGSCLPKYNKSGRIKDKFWYWCLAPNHKALHYGDCGEGARPSFDQLTNKLPLVDIQRLVTGKDCPHVHSRARIKSSPNGKLAFSIVTDAEDDQICFIAPSDYEFCMWVDGLNSLLGCEMTSPQVQHDLEMLLSMEIKIRLLETEGLQLPANPPPRPPPPQNLNFSFMNL